MSYNLRICPVCNESVIPETGTFNHEVIEYCPECGNIIPIKEEVEDEEIEIIPVEQKELSGFNSDPEFISKYYGVKGWLLFFCVSLTILSPLFTVYNLISGINESKYLINYYPDWLTVVVIDSILIVGLMVFSIYSGIALWTIKPNAVRVTKNYLYSLLAYVFISSFLPFTAGLPSQANEAMVQPVIMSALRSIVYFGIWFAFLQTSKRVKATYQ